MEVEYGSLEGYCPLQTKGFLLPYSMLVNPSVCPVCIKKNLAAYIGDQHAGL